MRRSLPLIFDHLESRQLQSVSAVPYRPTTTVASIVDKSKTPLQILKEKVKPIDLGPPGKFLNPGVIRP